MSTESIWKQIPEPEDADLSKLLNQIKLNDLQSRHPLEQLRKNFLMNIIWGLIINSGYIVLLWAYPLWQLFITIGLVFIAGLVAIVQGVGLYRSLHRSVSSKAPLLQEMKAQYDSISKVIKQQELYFLIIYPFAGAGGLDHVLSTGENVNILVLDTEVYSNTGGQKSKSTPIGSSAKFSVNGKTTGKKDLAMQAIAHGTAYVAQIAMGGNDMHTIRTILEAEAYPGPSLIIAYSHCIAHGIDMSHGAEEQDFAVKSGYWPLFHYNPLKEQGQRFVIDSKEPSMPLADFMYHENRFNVIKAKDPELAERFLHEAEAMRNDKWHRLTTLKGL